MTLESHHTDLIEVKMIPIRSGTTRGIKTDKLACLLHLYTQQEMHSIAIKQTLHGPKSFILNLCN